MITTSDKYKTAVNKSGRHFRCKIDIGGTTYTGIKGLKIKGGTNSSDEITLGDTVSSFIEFTLTDVPKNTLLKGKKAILYIGLDLIDRTTEWLKKGVYHLEKPIRTGEYIKITAYDNFSLCNKGFFTDLKGSQKIKTILDEQCKKIGITFAGGADDVAYNADKLKGMTVREVIGVLAAYCGKNAIMDSNGNLKFVWYIDTKISISPSRYADPLEMAEDDTYINRLDCAVENEKSLSAGTGIGIYFSCPGMTQERLNTLYNRIKGFTYRALTLDFKMAHPEIEAGDIIKVVDKDGTLYNVPLMEYEFNCDGGYYGNIVSKGKSQEEQENEYKGPLQTKVERTYSDLISTKHLLADKITAYEGEFEIISTNYLEVNKKFTAMEAEIENLDVTELTAKVAKIETSYVSKEYVQELYATKAEVHVLDVDLERVNTLLAGSVTAGSTQSIVLNAENTTISNALIKSAMIDSVAADKVTAGTIDASSIHFKSQSGRLDIFGETLQVRDADRVRVQIGKDGTGDYALSQWDADGNLMWDSRGAKAAAIKDKIIVNDMVSDNAGIEGKKINITSLVKEINDGSEVITSNHILYDGKSLDIVFDTISTKIDHLKIGGKNLLLYSDEKVTNDQYLIKTYTMTEKMTSGEVYTIRIWGKLGENKSYFTAYLDGGNTQLAILTKQNDGTYAATFDGIEGNLANSIIYIYVYDGNVVSTSTIEKIKLEKGNKYTDWTPAPEDINNAISGVDTKVTAVTETVKSHSTKLTAQDGKISTLISDTTQVKKDITTVQGDIATSKGSIITLQTDYSALDQSLKGLSSTVASHTSSITDFGTKVTAVTDKTAKLEQSLDGFKTTVSNTYATKSIVSNLSTTITQKVDSVAVNIRSSYNRINLIENSDFTNSTSCWSKSSNADGVASRATTWGSSTGRALYLNSSTFGQTYSWSQKIDINRCVKGFYISCEFLTNSDYVDGTTNPTRACILNVYYTDSTSDSGSVSDASHNWVRVGKFVAVNRDKTVDYVRVYLYGRDFKGIIAFNRPFLCEADSAIDPNYWAPAQSEITGNTSVVINSEGLRVNNGNISIYNTAGSKVFYGDTNGNLTLTGNITATSGKIGGFNIKSDRLLSNNNGKYTVIQSSGTYAFYAGSTAEAMTNAPFYITHNGKLYAQNAEIKGTISGSVIESSYIKGNTLIIEGDSYGASIYLGRNSNTNFAHFTKNQDGSIKLYSSVFGEISVGEKFAINNDVGIIINANKGGIVLQNSNGMSNAISYSNYNSGSNTLRPSTNYSKCYLGIASFRWVTLYAQNAVNVSSDIRLKTNIKDYDIRYEKMYMDLKPIIYELKNNIGQYHCGLIAQWTRNAMEKNGINDKEFGPYIYDAETDDYGIAYAELTSLNMHMIQKTIKAVDTQGSMLKCHEQAISDADRKSKENEYKIKQFEKQLENERQLRIEVEQKINAIISGEIRVLSRAV